MANKFKKNDKVIVITGAYKNKQSKIISIKGNKAIVEDVNLSTIHKKPTQSEPGAIVKKERPIDISNLSHVIDNKAVKIKYIKDLGEGKGYLKKYRQDKKKGNKIDN